MNIHLVSRYSCANPKPNEEKKNRINNKNILLWPEWLIFEIKYFNLHDWGGRGEIITAFYWTLNKRAIGLREKTEKWLIHVCEYSTTYRPISSLHEKKRNVNWTHNCSSKYFIGREARKARLQLASSQPTWWCDDANKALLQMCADIYDLISIFDAD